VKDNTRTPNSQRPTVTIKPPSKLDLGAVITHLLQARLLLRRQLRQGVFQTLTERRCWKLLGRLIDLIEDVTLEATHQ
jgi:hypothetical protein